MVLYSHSFFLVTHLPSLLSNFILSPSPAARRSPPPARISQQGVKGVLVTDHEGLCVAARGSLDAANAARFTSTLENAAKLGGETDEVPTVTVETAQSTITIVSKDGFITAVCK